MGNAYNIPVRTKIAELDAQPSMVGADQSTQSQIRTALLNNLIWLKFKAEIQYSDDWALPYEQPEVPFFKFPVSGLEFEREANKIVDYFDQLTHHADRVAWIFRVSQALDRMSADRHTTASLLTFGQAHELCMRGARIARLGWNGKGIFVAAQFPESNSKMTSPYLFIDTTGLVTDNAAAPRTCCPWTPSQTDMSACDWMVVK